MFKALRPTPTTWMNWHKLMPMARIRDMATLALSRLDHHLLRAANALFTALIVEFPTRLCGVGELR
jgi:hypothetical protein